MTADEYLIKRIEELEKIVDELTAALNKEKMNKSICFVFEKHSSNCEYKVNYKDGIITVEKINDDR